MQSRIETEEFIKNLLSLLMILMRKQ